MKYRLTCLTPALVGDGQKLAPIDYMVWKEHVNVLDQRRIFRLLAKGPRLDGYLAQLKKADRLDFASWGGFAQNFAGRRIPFEHAGSVPVWQRAPAQNLFIPTFAATHAGPYLPGTAIKGALRTGAVFERWTEGALRDLATRLAGERMPKNPARKAEEAALGHRSRVKRVAAGDSANVPYAGMKVYLLRVATLLAKGPGKYELGWKSARGPVDSRRVDESTPVFAEMAQPGTAFEGAWREGAEADRRSLFASANRYAAAQLARHRQYAEQSGLARLAAAVTGLEQRLAQFPDPAAGCLLNLGWGGGLLSKVAVADTENRDFRAILKQIALYQKAVQTGLPFPKTRRIVFQGGQPSALAGWAMLEVF
jgi:CRISPR-associated protein Csm5